MVGTQAGWAQLTGQTPEDYQGYGWSNAVHPDDAQPTIVAWEAAVAEKRPFVFEHRVRRHDGVWRRCAIRAVPIVDAENSIREWVGVHTDITDSRATQTRFRQLAETITEVFYVLELAAGRISYVSPAYKRVWRRSAEQLYSDPMAYVAAIHPDDRHLAEKALERQQKGLNTDVRYRLLHDDGTVTYIHDRAFVTSDPDTGAPRVVGLAEDVTTSTKARQLQDVLMREIEHRVRNSLSIVGGLLSMQERTASNDETAIALRSASSRVVAIARIHERLYKAKNLESVEFGAYLAALCDDLARTAAHDGLTFDVQTEAINIPVDQAVPLALVANELITNACKYAGRQGPAKIVARLTADDAKLTLAISDTGPGVPPSFDAKASIGLGMQVVSALVQQVRGMVEMPQPGAPATFVINVPITRV